MLIRLSWLLISFLILTPSTGAVAADRDDLLIADFEGQDYGSWKVEGTAFGPGPARGTLEGQMPVTGFLGNGLVNSFFKGDDSTGKLTSPTFKIERRHINFLIGGGKHPGETCINLVVDGRVVQTTSGPNDVAGGSEQLEWASWNVGEWEGKSALIEIIDSRKGGWGHINIDHIVQSDRERRLVAAARELLVDRRYLHIPVKNGARKVRMKILSSPEAATPLREFEVELAEGAADFATFCDLSPWKGEQLTITVDRLPADSKVLESLVLADKVPQSTEIYGERHRPQLHFTSRRGWLNDPNGLVYSDGLWHLFYQHNPYGWGWGNMHWGHAVSRDLFHWQELPIALYPHRYDDWAFSGSAIVDSQNSSSWKSGKNDLLVAAYTSTGRGECITYSNDGGATWTEYAGNPVVKHAGRDPKLLWYEPTKQWVMAVYDEFEGKQWIAFYNSKDLKEWSFQSRIEGFFECPDLFELPVANPAAPGKNAEKKWVLLAADGKYRLGRFDGKTFHPETEKLQTWYGNFYASQSYDNAPEARRIQIGWGTGVEFRGMPFNQQMVVPVELTLRAGDAGPRLFAEPVRELAGLSLGERRWTNLPLTSDKNPFDDFRGEQFRINAEIELGAAESVTLNVRGAEIKFDAQKKQLSCKHVSAPLAPQGGRIVLDIIVDRGSVEIFGNRGQVALSIGTILPIENRQITTDVVGNGAKFTTLQVTELDSVWKSP